MDYVRYLSNLSGHVIILNGHFSDVGLLHIGHYRENIMYMPGTKKSIKTHTYPVEFDNLTLNRK